VGRGAKPQGPDHPHRGQRQEPRVARGRIQEGPRPQRGQDRQGRGGQGQGSRKSSSPHELAYFGHGNGRFPTGHRHLTSLSIPTAKNYLSQHGAERNTSSMHAFQCICTHILHITRQNAWVPPCQSIRMHVALLRFILWRFISFIIPEFTTSPFIVSDPVSGLYV